MPTLGSTILLAACCLADRTAAIDGLFDRPRELRRSVRADGVVAMPVLEAGAEAWVGSRRAK